MTILHHLHPKAAIPWFKQWFDSAYYHKLYGNRDEREAADFINALDNYLEPAQGATMLDLGCGAGRHARELALRGYNVTGIDLSSASIRQARKSEMPALRFFRHDMRTPFGNQYFDYIFNFFTSFGYFKTQKENQGVVRNMSTALKTGGTLVLDYMNVQYVEDCLMPYEEKEIDGINYSINRWTNDQFIYKKILIDDESLGEPIENTEQVAKFRTEDFERMFQLHGLSIVEKFGDYQLSPFQLESSSRLIMIARKTE